MKKVDQKYYWYELMDASSYEEISTSEYLSLSKFLRTDGLPGGCSSLAMADGFLTALGARRRPSTGCLLNGKEK